MNGWRGTSRRSLLDRPLGEAVDSWAWKWQHARLIQDFPSSLTFYTNLDKFIRIVCPQPLDGNGLGASRSCYMAGIPHQLRIPGDGDQRFPNDHQPIYQRLARIHGVTVRVVIHKFGTSPAPTKLLYQKADNNYSMAIRCGVGNKQFARSYGAPKAFVST